MIIPNKGQHAAPEEIVKQPSAISLINQSVEKRKGYQGVIIFLDKTITDIPQVASGNQTLLAGKPPNAGL